MDTMMIIFFAVFGAIIGSFLNMLVYRMKDEETIMGRSMCRSCGRQIRWYDNVPVLSFLMLRGRCRDCGASISWQYPVVELITAGIFALIGTYFFSFEDIASWYETVWLILVASCFILVAAYDIRHMEIPIAPLVVSVAVTLSFFVTEYRFGEAFLVSRLGLGLAGAAAVGVFFFALVYVSHETWMGWGDVWLGAVAGMIVGLPSALFMLTLSFAAGSIIGIGGMYLGGKSLKSQVPFGPFLAFGAYASILFPVLFPEYALFFSLSFSGIIPI